MGDGRVRRAHNFAGGRAPARAEWRPALSVRLLRVRAAEPRIQPFTSQRLQKWTFAGRAAPAPTLLGEVQKGVPNPLEIGNLRIYGRQPRDCAGLHCTSRSVLILPQCQELIDLVQREPQLLRAADEQQPLQLRSAVFAITGFQPLSGPQQPPSLVVPHRLHVHVRPCRQFPDPHNASVQ